jgi:sulfonate transport system substrate-binding protein
MTSLVRRRVMQLAGLIPASMLAAPAIARTAPVIRFGVASAGVGDPPRITTGTMAVVQARRYLEDEFRSDGIKVEWVFFRGEGPAVNEALSNRQLDFSTQGGLPAIVGRSVGIDTRAVFVSGSRANTFVLVRANSAIRSVKELRGKRIAFHKGTATQLAANRILGLHGLTEREVRVLNLDPAAAQAALQAGDLDAIFGTIALLRLREAGVAKVIFSTSNTPAATSPSQVVVHQDFARREPDLTRRTVKALVRASHWMADEKNRDEVFSIWSKGGSISAAMYREEYAGIPLAERHAPQFDPFVLSRIQQSVEDAYQFKLIRRKFEVAGWTDKRYLDAAIRDLGLQAYWPAFDANGRRIPARAALSARAAPPAA